MSIFRASGRKARISRSSPTRCGPRMRNGSECVPVRKLVSSSGGRPAIWKGFMVIRYTVKNVTSLHCYIVTSLHRYIGFTIQRFNVAKPTFHRFNLSSVQRIVLIAPALGRAACHERSRTGAPSRGDHGALHHQSPDNLATLPLEIEPRISGLTANFVQLSCVPGCLG